MDDENKIIKVDFSDGKPEKPVWEGLYQWDIGTKLEIHGLELEEDTQVHFSLEEYSGEAPRMPGVYSDGVLTVGIPCFISEGEEERCYCYNDGYKAFAWIYIVRENYEETRKKIALHYKKRPKPADYISPGDTQLVLDVRRELNSKVSKTGHDPNKYLGTDENGNVVEKDAPTETANVVKYIEQTITDNQKKQARQNIGAASSEDLGRISATVNDSIKSNSVFYATQSDGTGREGELAFRNSHIVPTEITPKINDLLICNNKIYKIVYLNESSTQVEGNYLSDLGKSTDEQVESAVENYFDENPVDNAEVTAESIKTALGYTPAEETELNKVKETVNNLTGISFIEPATDDIPKVFIDGEIPINKTDVLAELTYVSKTENFHAYLEIKCQGDSSLSYPKKNFTIKMFSDNARETKLKKEFRGWGEHNKFVLKANYIDHSHARNIVSAKLWSQIVSSRSDYDLLPNGLKSSPNNGAIEGFPVKVYNNGTYQGIYTWNIPKEDWLYGVDEDDANQFVLYGQKNTNGVYAETANNFRKLWNGVSQSEGEWEVEVGTNSDIVKTALNNVISLCMNADDEIFKSTLNNYLDVQSALDYYIFCYTICALDSLAQNMILVSYDGIKLYCSAYDLDSTFGLWWNGQSFVSTAYRCPEDYQEPYSLLWERIEKLFADELKSRYNKLRKTVLSFSNMVTQFERFMDVIGLDLYAEDLTVYTGIPSGSTNNIKQIRNYIRDRLVYCDAEFEAMKNPILCTGVTLDKTELSFTDITPVTLKATVVPSNTTDIVIWESDNTSIASVKDGVVTPIANGTCTITVKCGSYSDSCAVSVSAFSENIPCTGITLDKTELSLNSLGLQKTLVATVVPSNTTDAIVWSSSNEKVATVENGVVTSIGEGNCTITAKCGNVSAQCSVVVSTVIDYSTVDYTVDAIEGVSWHDGYTYDVNTGAMVKGAGEHCTDKFTTQNCAYRITATGCQYVNVYVWDNEDNYICNTQENGNSLSFVGHSNYKFAIKAYNANSESIAELVTVMPIDNSETTLGYESIDFKDASWVMDSKGNCECDVTNILGGGSIFGIIDSSSLPIISGEKKIEYPHKVVGILNYMNRNYIKFKSSLITSAEEATNYFTNNPTVLELNIRQK